MKAVDHRRNEVILTDNYDMTGIFTPDQFQVIKQCKPNYPVPAIRQGFEWGTCLNDGSVTLLHWQQERFDG